MYIYLVYSIIDLYIYEFLLQIDQKLYLKMLTVAMNKLITPKKKSKKRDD